MIIPEFSEIYKEFYHPIARYLSRLVCPCEAEELAQETFLKVSRHLHEFNGRSSLSTWIYRIATNTATDRLRTPEFRQQMQTVPLQDSPDAVLAQELHKVWQKKFPVDAHEMAVKQEMCECIREFAESLPTEYKIILMLKDVDGMKNREISEILDLSLDVVKIRLHRARAAFRKKLQQGCEFYYTPDNELACHRKI